MRVLRAICAGVVLAGVGCFGMTTLPGCDDQTPSGTQVKVDPAEAAKREQMIKDMYNAKAPAKGHGAQATHTTKK